MDKTYTVKFQHQEYFTEVEFSKVYAANIRDAQEAAEMLLQHPSEWVCTSIERKD